MSWFRRGGAATDEAEDEERWSKVIFLNAGGVLYATTRRSLRAFSHHPIFGCILAASASPPTAQTGPSPVPVTDDGAYFIDCDGTMFRHVLNFIRFTSQDDGRTRGDTEPNQGSSTTPTEGVQKDDDDGPLHLPDPFHEWSLLLAEAQRLQLPALASAIAARYEYQRWVFQHALPLAVCVHWPTTVIVRESPAAPAVSTSVATTTTTGASPVLATSPPADYLARRALQISITPPLPGLRVSDDGRAVLYGPGRDVVPDLDRLVLLLLSAYGYRLEHWQEREGKAFLTLSENR